jgi:outer membrane protein insertion porin family
MDGLKPPLHSSSSPRDKEPKEVDKVFKWQQDRIARKLKGEYESAVFHLSEVVRPSIFCSTPLG